MNDDDDNPFGVPPELEPRIERLGVLVRLLSQIDDAVTALEPDERDRLRPWIESYVREILTANKEKTTI